jgi:adenosine/AMP kinase
MELKVIKLDVPAESNIILGQTHFIKSVEDIYEAVTSSAPGVRFGLAFSEASGACLVRVEGNDEELKKIASDDSMRLGCGHSFIILLRGAYPINMLTQLKVVPEVCTIFAATANPIEVIVAETELGRGLLGVVDGCKPKGVEDEEGKMWRKGFLRKIGYKL